MNPLHRLLRPIGDAARAFFLHDIALRRDAKGVKFVLEERSAEPAPETRLSQAERRKREELERMRVELAAVLGEVPGTRDALRHLAFVEQALARSGLRALEKVPVDVLQRALEQLESLVTNWSPAGLATLRARMAVAVIDREHQAPEDAEDDIYRTAAVLDLGTLPPSIPISSEGVVDESALLQAYAGLGTAAPVQAVEMQGELGSRSARATGQTTTSPGRLEPIRLRELQG